MKISNFLAKLRALPEKKKVIIIFFVVIIIGLPLGFFWLKSAVYSFSKIGESLKSVNLPDVEIPKEAQDALSEIKKTVDEANKVNTEIADWKTYTNEKYGFELKYPANYEHSKLEALTGTSVPEIDQIRHEDEDHILVFHAFARSDGNTASDCLGQKDTKEINGSKFNVVYEKIENPSLKDKIPGSLISEYNIIHNSYCYIIQFSIIPRSGSKTPPTLEQKSITEEKFKTLEQIFSTFIFIK